MMARFIAKLWMKLFIFLHSLSSTSRGESETTISEYLAPEETEGWLEKNIYNRGKFLALRK